VKRAVRRALGLALAAAVAAAGELAGADASREGPFGWTYATYASGLYGPDVPLSQLIEQAGLARADGRLVGARLLVIKSERRVELWVGERMVKAYRAQLGQRPTGPKIRRGDKKTPEGRYSLCALRPSKYHRALWLSYPNLDDADRAWREGRISRGQRDAIAAALERGECPPASTALGGMILIHGQQPSLTASQLARQRRRASRAPARLEPGDVDPSAMREYLDWTNGCVSLFNPDVRELHALLPIGTPVTIVARGTATPPARGAPAREARRAAPDGGGGS
jgi:murein L,D-transpeptidase YafK